MYAPRRYALYFSSSCPGCAAGAHPSYAHVSTMPCAAHGCAVQQRWNPAAGRVDRAALPLAHSQAAVGAGCATTLSQLLAAGPQWSMCWASGAQQGCKRGWEACVSVCWCGLLHQLAAGLPKLVGQHASRGQRCVCSRYTGAHPPVRMQTALLLPLARCPRATSLPTLAVLGLARLHRHAQNSYHALMKRTFAAQGSHRNRFLVTLYWVSARPRTDCARPP